MSSKTSMLVYAPRKSTNLRPLLNRPVACMLPRVVDAVAGEVGPERRQHQPPGGCCTRRPPATASRPARARARAAPGSPPGEVCSSSIGCLGGFDPQQVAQRGRGRQSRKPNNGFGGLWNSIWMKLLNSSRIMVILCRFRSFGKLLDH